MVRSDWLRSDAHLPPGLTAGHVGKAVDYIERELADLVDIYFEQMNVFSAVVGIFGAKGLDSISSYEKHRHADTAQQRFPDLKRKGSGPNPPPMTPLRAKVRNGLGRSNHTTTIPAGT